MIAIEIKDDGYWGLSRIWKNNNSDKVIEIEEKLKNKYPKIPKYKLGEKVETFSDNISYSIIIEQIKAYSYSDEVEYITEWNITIDGKRINHGHNIFLLPGSIIGWE